MAKYSKSEFAELCDIGENYVRTYISRGKILIGDDGLIDTALPMNADFMAKRAGNTDVQATIPKHTAKNIGKNIHLNATTIPASNPKGKRGRPKKQPEREMSLQENEHDVTAQHQVTAYNLDKQIKEAELEKKNQEIELNKLRIAKMSGEVIPTQLVRDVFAQHFKSVTTAFHQGSDNFIMTIAKMSGMDRSQIAKMRESLIDIVNEAIKDSVENSKASIKNIVSEYKEKRGVGEKK